VPPSTYSFTIYSIVTPIWFIAPFVSVALFRRPGVGLVTAVIGGLVNFVTPFGLAQFVNFLVAGICIELPFAIALYRRWSDRAVAIGLSIAGVLMSATYFAVCWFGGVIDPLVFVPWPAVATVLGIPAVSVCVAVIAIVIARRLSRAGVGARTARPGRA
jgi:ABC-type thiamin/hydroxymethylpyrimidine transport system permease subunit